MHCELLDTRHEAKPAGRANDKSLPLRYRGRIRPVPSFSLRWIWAARKS
jgi:hypothetical protein